MIEFVRFLPIDSFKYNTSKLNFQVIFHSGRRVPAKVLSIEWKFSCSTEHTTYLLPFFKPYFLLYSPGEKR